MIETKSLVGCFTRYSHASRVVRELGRLLNVPGSKLGTVELMSRLIKCFYRILISSDSFTDLVRSSKCLCRKPHEKPSTSIVTKTPYFEKGKMKMAVLWNHPGNSEILAYFQSIFWPSFHLFFVLNWLFDLWANQAEMRAHTRETKVGDGAGKVHFRGQCPQLVTSGRRSPGFYRSCQHVHSLMIRPSPASR